MKVKVEDLQGKPLDWAYAKSNGYRISNDGINHLVEIDGVQMVLGDCTTAQGKQCGYSPSTCWAQLGPTIDEKKIAIRHYEEFESLPERWLATIDHRVNGIKYCLDVIGPTALIAVARCVIIVNLLDNEIDVPDDILSH